MAKNNGINQFTPYHCMSTTPHTPFFRTIAIVGKHQTAGIDKPLLSIANFAAKQGFKVVFEADTAKKIGIKHFPSWTVTQIGHGADVAIVVGGDGTMLGIGRQLAQYNIPLIGINQGRVGFLTDITLDDTFELLGQMLTGHCEYEERTMLAGEVVRMQEGQPSSVFSASALNDVVVSRSSTSGMVELKVEVNGRFMYNQRSDGLIVASPTGSTAYALSANGPILHPCLKGIVLAPIAPHSLSNRPIVLPDDCEIVIEIQNGFDVTANFDMQSFTSLSRHDRVHIRRSSHTVTFLHPVGYSYFATLRKKLHWHEFPSDE